MRPEALADAGLSARLVAAVRRHPGVSVPVAAAALAAAVGFSVSTYVYAATLAQSEDLHVPLAFVPQTPRVESVGRGLIVVAAMAAVTFGAIVLLERVGRQLARRRSAPRNRWLHRWLQGLSPGFELAARATGLLAVSTALAFAWLNAIVVTAFVWTPNPIVDGWVVEETADTTAPVLVLHDQAGAILLRPLKRLGDQQYALCGLVTRPPAADAPPMRYVENLGSLVGESC